MDETFLGGSRKWPVFSDRDDSKKNHLTIRILLPWEEQVAQPLHQGCWLRTMECHKTFCVIWGKLLNILPIPLPKKKRIIASNSLGCLRINIWSIVRRQDTAVMEVVLKLPVPFHELVLMLYIVLQGNYQPSTHFQTMKALDVSPEG